MKSFKRENSGEDFDREMSMAHWLVVTNIPNGQLGDVYRDNSFHGGLADGVLLWILGAHPKVASLGHTRKWHLWGTPESGVLGRTREWHLRVTLESGVFGARREGGDLGHARGRQLGARPRAATWGTPGV